MTARNVSRAASAPSDPSVPDSIIRSAVGRTPVEVENDSAISQSGGLLLSITRAEFEELLVQLNDSACMFGVLKEVYANGPGYEHGAIRQALRLVEHVASELDAAMPRSPAGAEPESRDWRAQCRGSIADMLSRLPGGPEEATRRLKAGESLADICKEPISEIEAEKRTAQDAEQLLTGATRLLRTAASLFVSDPEAPDMDDVGELVRTAADRLIAWFAGSNSDPDEAEEAAFHALDACTAVTALINAGLNPRNSKTISPIHGVLSMAVERLEGWGSVQPAAESGAPEIPEPLARHLMDQQSRACELRELLRHLARHDDQQAGILTIAARTAEEIDDALDVQALRRWVRVAPEPMTARCAHCGGSGYDEDARCEFCDGTGRGVQS